MNFNTHLELEGKHAFLSPSKYHWLNYDEVVLRQRYLSSYAETIGTSLHELAYTLIKNKVKVRKNDTNVILVSLLKDGIPRNVISVDKWFNNLATYVNDAIGYRMSPEVILKYSNNCFGTADAIAFDPNTKFLRIHDLKTGTTTASMKQLEIYMALFCLEYAIDPRDISSELRIYQLEEIVVEQPNPSDILEIIATIKEFDEVIEKLKAGEQV